MSPAARRHRLAALALAALTTVAGCSSAGGDATRRPVPTIPAPAGPNTPFTAAPALDVPPAPAADAADAVRRYVAAEAAGDWAASWALLADDDRTRVGSVEAWAGEADDRLPLRSLETVALDGSAVATVAALEARLDETAVVPGRARITWRPVRVAGGWLVSPAATTVEPLLPAESGATDAAARWVDGRRRGEVVDQYAGNLLGRPTLVDRLPDGAYRAGAPAPLESAPDPQVAVQAFGPEAARLVRAVPVDGPVRLVVLTAPLGDAWQVVGVQAPG